ncbi:MarR family winged helix-turn-helix transcriptional regulator [Actinomadura alba]|uniref:MarR family transcriptional regulator n=1 Tax=Actinomadura alba TaxID=406431 RepID=A0ABR7LZD6_9ACTN|nr:MarR family transcriptional regulator [Actinomadura alba]MBC6470130.1 MarR family transcriptional regulator [Actinomadura alba]
MTEQKPPADRRAATDRIIDAMPDWVTASVQLNSLIAERMGVVASDFHCLHALNRGGPATAAALADRVGLTPGSLSRMIDRLESAGLVKRRPDPHDRRKTLIEATAEGLARISDYYAGLNARTRDVLADFTDDQLDSVLHFVQAAHAGTQNEVDRLRTRPPGCR